MPRKGAHYEAPPVPETTICAISSTSPLDVADEPLGKAQPIHKAR